MLASLLPVKKLLPYTALKPKQIQPDLFVVVPVHGSLQDIDHHFTGGAHHRSVQVSAKDLSLIIARAHVQMAIKRSIHGIDRSGQRNDFKAAAENTSSSYEVNPQNATQLTYGDRTYQVTEETVPTEQLGAYLDILNETVTFDMDSKRPLSKEELNRIDWAGTSAGQQRERWFYMDVYEISGTNPADAVAGKVNNQYHIARVQ